MRRGEEVGASQVDEFTPNESGKPLKASERISVNTDG
jgi:hypothetical protein